MGQQARVNSSPRATIWHTVFPASTDTARRRLYIDGESSSATVLGRTRLLIAGGGRVSLGSYFNAFPAAYWRAFTPIQEVLLSVRTQGIGTVTVYRSWPSAPATVVTTATVDGAADTEFRLELQGFAGYGALWFDLHATGSDPLVLEAAEWQAASIARATATIAMATFNRASECVAQLRQLADDESVWEVLDRIVVVDQGDDVIAGEPDFPRVRARLGNRLDVIRQPNLGGSGGFSRGMAEALWRGDSTHVLLLDDDAISEPEAIIRALRFAGAAPKPTIVGGGMLHLDAPSVLYAQSEQWNGRTGWVRLGRPDAYNHDFAKHSFREAKLLHMVQHSDFNGWWMCAIPVSLLREHGLSLPLFLKGDDVEFGLRARARGVETVSPPGIALWHMGWAGKAPTRTWEGYFLHRNRLITELLHSPSRRPFGVVVHCLLGDVKLLLSLQYSALRLRAEAVADVFDDPLRLTEWLLTKPAEVRRWWSQYPDARRVSDIQAPTIAVPPPTSRFRAALLVGGLAWRHLVVPVPAVRRTRPQGRIVAADLGYWTFASRDSMLVESPDGSGYTWFVRSRRETRMALRRTIRLYATLWWRWPTLAARWRSAAESLSSSAAWVKVFER